MVFALNSQIGQFEQSFRKIGIGTKSLLEELRSFGFVSLPLLDITHVEEAGSVARIFFQPLLKIFLGFVESAQVPVRESHESKRPRRRIEIDQFLELNDRLFGLAGHEVTFSRGSVEIGPLG